MENPETKEKLVIKKMVYRRRRCKLEQKLVLIMRYPSNSDKKWIETNECAILEWDFYEQFQQTIAVSNPIKDAM
jgi:hypothetical protein